MYSIKEKNKHLRDLLAVQHAEKDLELLRKLDPRNDQLPSLSLSPRRNYERILYILLDVAAAEEIRTHRRELDLQAEEEAAKKVAEEEAKKLADTKTETTDTDSNESNKTETAPENADADQSEETTDASDKQADATDTDSDEAPVTDSDEKVEQLPPPEGRAGEGLEKKSTSSKKKTSTPKSTGKTSATKTSK